MINNYTLPTFKDFLIASAAQDFNLVVLMQIQEQRAGIMDLIRDTGLDLDTSRISFLAPNINDRYAPPDTSDLLRQASGILVLGGNAHFYQKMYATPEISKIVEEKYLSGIPYAGISAGAILSLNYKLLENVALKPHFSEKKRFNELISKMKKNKVKYGFGLDDNISLIISDNTKIKCLGKDSFYLFTRQDQYDFGFNILKNLNVRELS